MNSPLQRTVLLLSVLLLIILSATGALAANDTQQDSEVTIYFFWGDGCPHCADEKPFLEDLDDKYPEIEVKMYETWNNQENANLFQEVAEAYGTSARGVPTTFVGEDYWIGYADNIGTEIENKVVECIDLGCDDLAKAVISPSQSTPLENNSGNVVDTNGTVNESGLTTIPSGNHSEELCVHVFVDYECGECAQTIEYLDGLNLSDVAIRYHNVNNASEKQLYDTYKEMYGLSMAGYPSVFLGDSYLIGINSIQKNFVNTLEDCQDEGCPCPVENIKGYSPSMPQSDFKSEQNSDEIINVPLLGEINIGKMPLVVMTGLIAFVDGFNPCSLWVLTFLLGIVIYSRSRKKIFLVGLTFLIVTTLGYGLFMLGLINVFKYVGYTFWIKVGVALIATIFAVVNIKDYFWYKKGLSFTISDKYKPKLFKKVRRIMNPNNSLTSMLTATALMATAIVLVELPCTAGFPMIWTNIIADNAVTGMTFALLFGLYMFIYLLDELVIFTGVTLTLKASKFEEKHGRILKLVGGLIMLALAIALVFFPDMMDSVGGSLIVFGSAVVVAYLIMLIHRKILPRFGINIGTEQLKTAKPDDKKTTGPRKIKEEPNEETDADNKGDMK